MIALLAALAGLTVVYQHAVSAGPYLVVPTLLVVGTCIFGAQVLLVGAFPVDLARPGTEAATVGFVNCMGYIGAAAGDVATGVLVDRFGWRTAVYGWASYALVAAALLVPLWRASAHREASKVASCSSG